MNYQVKRSSLEADNVRATQEPVQRAQAPRFSMQNTHPQLCLIYRVGPFEYIKQHAGSGTAVPIHHNLVR